MPTNDDNQDDRPPLEWAEEIPFAGYPDEAFDRAGFVFHEGRAARKRGEEAAQTPYTQDQLAHSFWLKGWEIENGFLTQLAEERQRNMQAAEPTPTLTLLGESFAAGDYEALHEALFTCFKSSTPPMRWMVEAAATMSAPPTATEERGGRHANHKTRYQDRLAHFMRYVAVAGCRHNYNALIEIEKYNGKCPDDALAEVRKKYGKRPSWEQCYANASLLLKGSCAVCTADTARKSYELVKKDIEQSGGSSVFVKGIINNSEVWHPFLQRDQEDSFDGTEMQIWMWPPEIW